MHVWLWRAIWENVLPAQHLTDILVNDSRLLATPVPCVTVAEWSKNNMQFALRAWSKISDYEAVRGSILEQIKLAFDQHSIVMT